MLKTEEAISRSIYKVIDVVSQLATLPTVNELILGDT